MSSGIEFNTPLSRIFLVFGLIISTNTILSHCGASAVPQEPPKLYLGGHIKSCLKDSPEIFYRNVAVASIYTLHEETKGFFGILMDKLEASTTEMDEDEQEQLEKQWEYIMETIQKSLDSTFHRIRNFWAIIVSIWDAQALPWEMTVKGQVMHEFIHVLEYEYMMVEAIIKAGVKEIVGTLQRQVSSVIKQLENEVSKAEGKDVTERNLLEKMNSALKKMDKTFIGKILNKIVQKALNDKTRRPNDPLISRSTEKTFLSDSMEQCAILFQAYRSKGHEFPNFWSEITTIMLKEYSIRDISEFFSMFSKDEDKFILNVFAILASKKQ